MNGIIKIYTIIAFEYNGKEYKKTINRSEMDFTIVPNEWFWYFDEDGMRFEVIGRVDDQGNPLTGMVSEVFDFVVNVYDLKDGNEDWMDQIYDIEVIERV